jgi:hypothetical protein
MSDAGFRDPSNGVKEQTNIMRIIGPQVTLNGLQRRGREVQPHREALEQLIERNRKEAGYMVSMHGEALSGMCLDHIIWHDPSDDLLCPACTRSLTSAVLLQRDDERMLICPYCGWEMHE